LANDQSAPESYREAGREKARSAPWSVPRWRGLEGSRFVAWQLYRLAAGGSRERLDVRQLYGPLYRHNTIEAMGKTLRWVIPGSRLLTTGRAAIL